MSAVLDKLHTELSPKNCACAYNKNDKELTEKYCYICWNWSLKKNSKRKTKNKISLTILYKKNKSLNFS